MNYFDIDAITFRQLEICIKVMELKSFTEAANALYISQPTISKQIANLEQLLGITLFIRSKNEAVVPTPAGRMLIEKWKILLDVFYRDVAEASDLMEESERPLTLFLPPSMNVATYFRPVLRQFSKQMPGVMTRVSLGTISRGMEDLLANRADILICNPFHYNLSPQGKLEIRYLAHAPWYVGISKKNPLAQKETVTWEDLRDMKFVMPSSQSFMHAIDHHCSQAGYHPKISAIHRYVSGLADNISSDDEVFITDPFMKDYGLPAYRYFPMPDTESHGIQMAVRKDKDNETLHHLAELLTDRVTALEQNGWNL